MSVKRAKVAVDGCRWPTKYRHASKADALAAIAALERAGRGSPDMSVYQCGEHWHTGHSIVKFKARIERSLRGGRPKRSKSNRKGRR
ncbi:MAG: hypothetical protein H6515_14375 [Microthrixaceae bacterium]|nr:hypothetical protein [Microthrixaceae bacterium]